MTRNEESSKYYIQKKMISVKRERWQILESYCESGRYVSMSITSQRFVVSLQKLRMLEMNTKNDQKISETIQFNSPFFNTSPFLRKFTRTANIGAFMRQFIRSTDFSGNMAWQRNIDL